MRDLRRSLEENERWNEYSTSTTVFGMQFLLRNWHLGRDGDNLVHFAFGKMDPRMENIGEPVNY